MLTGSSDFRPPFTLTCRVDDISGQGDAEIFCDEIY